MRFGIFSFTPLTGNIIKELFFAASLRQTEDEVYVVQCNGQPRCHLATTMPATSDRAALCASCLDVARTLRQAGGVEGVQELLLDSLWLPERQASLHAQIDALADEALYGFKLGEHAVGEWVKASLRIEYFGEDWQQLAGIGDKARLWLKTSVNAVLAAEQFIARYQPEALIVVNGMPAPERAVWETAKAAGVRCVSYEEGLRPGTLSLKEDGPACLFDFHKEWAEWAAIPLSVAENRGATQMLADRMTHGKEVWRDFVFSPAATGDHGAVRTRLGLAPSRPLMVAFTNVTGDTSVFAAQRAFSSQLAWLEACVAYAVAHPEIDLVIRIHPAEQIAFRQEGEAAHAKQLVAASLVERCDIIPPNVRILPSNDSTSSYDLLRICRLALVYVTSVGMEAAALGVPVIASGRCHYSENGFVWPVMRREDFEPLVERLLRAPQAPPQAQELARRYMYFLYYRTCLTAPAVKALEELRPYIADTERYLSGYGQIVPLTRQPNPEQALMQRALRGETPFVVPPAPWRPHDGPEGAVALPTPFPPILLALIDPSAPEAVVQTLVPALLAADLRPALLLLVQDPDRDAPRVASAVAACGEVSTLPEIDVVPQDLPAETLGQILALASALVSSQPVDHPLHAMAAALKLPVFTTRRDDLAACLQVVAESMPRLQP